MDSNRHFDEGLDSHNIVMESMVIMLSFHSKECLH